MFEMFSFPWILFFKTYSVQLSRERNHLESCRIGTNRFHFMSKFSNFTAWIVFISVNWMREKPNLSVFGNSSYASKIHPIKIKKYCRCYRLRWTMNSNFFYKPPLLLFHLQLLQIQSTHDQVFLDVSSLYASSIIFLFSAELILQEFQISFTWNFLYHIPLDYFLFYFCIVCNANNIHS